MSDSEICPHEEWAEVCIDCLQIRIAELETELERQRQWTVDAALLTNRKYQELKAENAKLREAAQAVVETDADARRQQITHWKNPTIDALAAAIETEVSDE